MTEPAKPRPPATHELPAFRELFLMLFPEDDAAALRRSGILLQNAVQEGEPYDSGEPMGAQEIRAVSIDLLFVARYLETLGSPAAQRGLDPKELVLARLAGRSAAEIARVVLRLMEAVGDPPKTTEEGR